MAPPWVMSTRFCTDQPEILRSTDIPSLLGPEGFYNEYLQRHHGVSICKNKRRLHVKGSKNAAVACLGVVRKLLAEWRRREAASLIAENQEEAGTEP